MHIVSAQILSVRKGGRGGGKCLARLTVVLVWMQNTLFGWLHSKGWMFPSGNDPKDLLRSWNIECWVKNRQESSRLVEIVSCDISQYNRGISQEPKSSWDATWWNPTRSHAKYHELRFCQSNHTISWSLKNIIGTCNIFDILELHTGYKLWDLTFSLGILCIMFH